MIDKITEPCLACGSNNWVKPPSYAPRAVYAKCSFCGLLKTDKGAISSDLQSVHNASTATHDLERADKSGTFCRYHANRLKFVLDKIPNKNFLTIGCGLGSDIKVVRQFGLDVYAIEKSRCAINFLKENFKINIAEDIDLIRLPADKKFGLIYMCHIFEHLEKPKDTLNKLLPVAEQGCYFVIVVPNYFSWAARIIKEGWAGWNPGEHYFHFTKRALRTLLERCGLKSTHIFTGNRLKSYNALVWYGQEKARNTLKFKLISLLCESIRVRLLAYAESAFNFISRVFNAADEIIIYARK